MSVAPALATVSPAAAEPESWTEMLTRVATAGGRLLITPQLTPCGTPWFYVEELASQHPRVTDFVVAAGGGVAAIGSNR